jgi:hypothetical protein
MASAFQHFEAPVGGAPLCSLYQQFLRVDVSAGIEAASAWIGDIRPFSSDSCARAFLESIECDKPIWISGGNVREEKSRQRHWANRLLVNMTVSFRTLLLILPAPAHPRSYLISPTFPEHYSWVHPHPRFDQTIEFEGRKIPGLCIYSAAEFQFKPDDDPMTQYLDQLTIYLGKHLIWLRTRELIRGFPPGGQIVRSLQGGEELIDDRPIRVPALSGRGDVWQYWRGYWPGRSASFSNPQTHLLNIAVDQQCWCGSGGLYGDCHRNEDASKAAGRNI